MDVQRERGGDKMGRGKEREMIDVEGKSMEKHCSTNVRAKKWSKIERAGGEKGRDSMRGGYGKKWKNIAVEKRSV